MPLDKRLINVPLSAGLGQKEDIRGLAPMQAATMQNCVRLKNGAIRKRAGMASLSKSFNSSLWNSGTLSLAVSGGSFRNASWVTNQKFILEWSDEQAQWFELWPIPEAQALDRVPVTSQIANVLDVDWCICNGQAWITYSFLDPNSVTTGIFLAVLDASGFGQSSGTGGLQQGITGSVIRPAAPIVTGGGGDVRGSAPKIIACGTSVILTYVDSTGKLQVNKYDATNPSGLPTVATLVAAAGLSSAAQGGAYDIAPIVGDATRFLIAYCSNTPTATLQTVTVSSLAVGTARTPGGGLAINATSVSCYATNGGYLWASWGVIASSKRTLYAGFYNEGSATISTTSTAYFTDSSTGIPMGKIGLCPANTDASGDVVAAVWSTGYASGATAMQSAQTQYTSLTGSGATFTVLPVQGPVVGAQLASRPILDPLNPSTPGVYAALSTPSTLQGSVYVCALSNIGVSGGGARITAAAAPVACVVPRLQKQVAQPIVSSMCLPHMLPIAAIPSLAQVVSGLGVQAFPVIYSTSTFHTAVALQPIDFFSTPGRAYAELGSVMGMACGLPVSWDGQAAAEMGFCGYPEPTVTDVVGGGSLSAGTYQYIVTYEWYDNAGNIHRSATSPTQTITAAANDSATIVIPNVIGRRNPNANIGGGADTQPVYGVVWRTTAGGSTFYRQTADPATSTNALLPNTQTVTITDTMSDATLTASSTAQILYTTGGNLDELNPPSARCLVKHTQRWFLAGGDDPTIVWASKALAQGVAPGFNEQLAFFASGAVRALASMDDKLIIGVQRGTQYGLEYVTGQGPLDTGAQSDWSPPLPIPTNVGPIDQRGTCVGDFGMLFRSPVGGPNGTGGIFLLSRDLQVTYVGAPVEDALAASPVVTSMVGHPNAGRVYVTLITNDASPATASSVTRLVWDYVNGGVWSTDNVWDTDASAGGLAVRCAWVAATAAITGAPQANAYWCASSAGRVYRENDLGSGAGAFLDSTSQWVTMTYKSAPLKPDLDGFARFWRVQLQADSLETHDFTMQLLYDYAPSSYYQESHTWTAAQAATFDRFPQLDVEMLCGNQKAKAIQVVLTDATPTGGGATTGQGPSWSTISLELGVKAGRYPNLPSAQRS